MYVETFGDPKVRRLTPEHRWLWAAILGAARSSPEPGLLLISVGEPYSELDLADFAALPVKVVRSGVEVLIRQGMVGRDADGSLFVPRWGDRQFESDVSTPRVAEHRRNVDETANGTVEDARCNAPENREQRTDTDEKQVVLARTPPERPPAFELFYATYPRKRKPHDALRAWLKATKTTAPDVIQAAVEAHAAMWDTWPKSEQQFIPYPASWLNAGEFLCPPPEPKSGTKQETRQQANREALVEGVGKVDTRPFAERAIGDRTSGGRQLPPGAIDTTAEEH